MDRVRLEAQVVAGSFDELDAAPSPRSMKAVSAPTAVSTEALATVLTTEASMTRLG